MYLSHYGILGMKWGIRRYQNPDGSLTTAGKAHYGKKLLKSARKYSNDSSSFKAHMEKTGMADRIRDSINRNEKVKKYQNKLDDLYSRDVSPSKEDVNKATEMAVNELKPAFKKAFGRDYKPGTKDERIMFDYLDNADAAYEKALKKITGGTSLDSKIDSTATKLAAAEKEAINDIIGKYGKKKINKYTDLASFVWRAL